MSVNVDQITANALKLKPARIALWVLAAPFIVVGVLLRLLWLAPAFLIASGVEGWKMADAAYQRWREKPRQP